MDILWFLVPKANARIPNCETLFSTKIPNWVQKFSKVPFFSYILQNFNFWKSKFITNFKGGANKKLICFNYFVKMTIWLIKNWFRICSFVIGCRICWTIKITNKQSELVWNIRYVMWGTQNVLPLSLNLKYCWNY